MWSCHQDPPCQHREWGQARVHTASSFRLTPLFQLFVEEDPQRRWRRPGWEECLRDSCCRDLVLRGGGAQYMWRRAVGAQSICCLGQQWMQQRRNQYPCRQCSKDMRDSNNIYHEYSGYTHALFQVYFVHMLIICLSYEVLDSNSTVWKVCKFLPRLSLTRQPRIRFSWAEVHSWPESGCIHNPSAKVW